MENLVKQAMDKNKDAFSALIHKYLQSLYKTAYAMLGNDEDVADAIQDTVLACWEKLNELQKPRYFKTWMTRILINKCNDVLRKKQKYVCVENIPEQSTIERGFEEVYWKEIMNLLNPNEQVVVNLFYGDGFKCVEIAKMLEVKEETIRKRLARARNKIADIYFRDIRRR